MRKFMKISAALLAVNMFMSVLPASYAQGGLILSAPTYTIGSTETETPQPGFVTTTVDATNPGDSDISACLVVSVTDKDTGKLVAVDVDSQTVPKNGSKKLSKGINLGANQTLNYYVWDNIPDHTPLRNTPPTDVKNVESKVKTNSADISWDEALDDKAVKNYILKVNGDEVAKSDSAAYTILGLDRNSSYNCEVLACDEEGLVSKNAASFDVSTYDVEKCILAENTNKSVSFYENHSSSGTDSYTESDNVAGRDCYKNAEVVKSEALKYASFFYFPVAPAYINSEIRNVAFEVTYFDDEISGSPSIQYNAEDGASGKACTLDAKTNSKTWKTVHAQVSDAKFVNSASLTNSSFRIACPKGTRIYKVALCPGDNYSPEAPNVKFSDTTDTYDMLFYPEDAMSAYNMYYTEITGVQCMCAPTGNKFEFDIKDDCATRTGGYIEVNYLDDGEDELVLNYNNAGGLKKSVPFTDTRVFKTVVFPLEAATFTNGINGAGGRKFDFTLSTKNGNQLAITSVKYVPGDSDYVIPPLTEVYAEVNADGTALDGALELNAWPNTDLTKGYDKNVMFSGQTGRAAQDGKHYLFNQEFTGFASGQSWKRWKNAFYFKIPDSFIFGDNYGTIEIKVEYYAPSGNIELLAKNASGSDKSIGKVSVEANMWSKVIFTVTASDEKNIVFSNSLSDCDFRINFDCQAYVHKVTVKKISE